MTKKESLLNSLMTMERNKKLCMDMALPYSNDEIAETITIPYEYIPQKWNYVSKNYDDNLVMKNNNEVKIISFYFI